PPQRCAPAAGRTQRIALHCDRPRTAAGPVWPAPALRRLGLGSGDKTMNNKTAPALSIVIPVYNGAATVPALVAALAALEVAGGLEIILVNDGSADDSLAVCRRLCTDSPVPLTVVNLARNFGEHNAVMAG